MRRVLTRLTPLVLLVAIVAGPMSAPAAGIDPTITVRHDPNETDNRILDIRRVLTRMGSPRVLLRVGMWRAFGLQQGQIIIDLDTRGTGQRDRLIEMPLSGKCLVQNNFGDVIGEVPVGHPTNRDVLCRVPTRWLGIEKPVGFVVRTSGGNPQTIRDRAPNTGRYVGL